MRDTQRESPSDSDQSHDDCTGECCATIKLIALSSSLFLFPNESVEQNALSECGWIVWRCWCCSFNIICSPLFPYSIFFVVVFVVYKYMHVVRLVRLCTFVGFHSDFVGVYCIYDTFDIANENFNAGERWSGDFRSFWRESAISHMIRRGQNRM